MILSKCKGTWKITKILVVRSINCPGIERTGWNVTSVNCGTVGIFLCCPWVPGLTTRKTFPRLLLFLKEWRCHKVDSQLVTVNLVNECIEKLFGKSSMTNLNGSLLISWPIQQLKTQWVRGWGIHGHFRCSWTSGYNAEVESNWIWRWTARWKLNSKLSST